MHRVPAQSYVQSLPTEFPKRLRFQRLQNDRAVRVACTCPSGSRSNAADTPPHPLTHEHLFFRFRFPSVSVWELYNKRNKKMYYSTVTQQKKRNTKYIINKLGNGKHQQTALAARYDETQAKYWHIVQKENRNNRPA